MELKAIVESLSDENIKKKEFDSALEKIANKTNEIWHFICAESKRKLDWWAFGNDVDLGNGNGSTGGEFDPSDYSEFIPIIGQNSSHKNPFYEYNDGFPTRFLWEDYQTEVLQHLENIKKLEADKKEKDKTKNAAKKIKKEELIASIKNKLNSEELKLVKFK